MALSKCPRCGNENKWGNKKCSSCGFDMEHYINTLVKNTQEMNTEEQKSYIYEHVELPIPPKAPARENKSISEKIKFHRKEIIYLSVGILDLLIVILDFSMFLLIISILCIIGGISTWYNSNQDEKSTQDQYTRLKINYEYAIRNPKQYKTVMTDVILKEVQTVSQKRAIEYRKQEKKKFYSQPLIPCPACGKEISSDAETCIHCGYPLKRMLIKEGYRTEGKKTAPMPPLVKCPKCGSTSIATQERGWDINWGNWGATSKKNLCQNCGYTWWPGKKK